MDEAEIITKVKEFATEIYTALGGGYNECVYGEALALELRKANIDYDVEFNTEIMYKDERVGTHKLDIVIEEKVIVELKTSAISNSHKGQIGAYLRTLGLKKGLIIFFPFPDGNEPTFEEITIEEPSVEETTTE